MQAHRGELVLSNRATTCLRPELCCLDKKAGTKAPRPKLPQYQVRIARTGFTIRQFRDRSWRYDYDANVMSLRPKMAFFQISGAVAQETSFLFRRINRPHVSRKSWGLRVWVFKPRPPGGPSGSSGPRVKPLPPAGSKARKEAARGPRATSTLEVLADFSRAVALGSHDNGTPSEPPELGFRGQSARG